MFAAGEVFRRSDDMGYYVQLFDQAAADKPDDVAVRWPSVVCRGRRTKGPSPVISFDARRSVISPLLVRSWDASSASRGRAWRTIRSSRPCV